MMTLLAQAVPAAETTLLTGTGATKEEVVHALPGATHIHLACHGEAVRDLRALGGGLFNEFLRVRVNVTIPSPCFIGHHVIQIHVDGVER